MAAADVVEPGENAVGESALLPDPRALLVILRRRLPIFLSALAMILGSAVAYANLAPREYSSIAKLLIEPRRGDPVPQSGAAASDQAPSSDFIDTQILVLDSPQLSARVATALELLDDPEFGGAVPIHAADGPTPAQKRARLVTAAQRLRSLVVIRRAGQTALIEIGASTRSPLLSARIANQYVAQYLIGIQEARAASERQLNAKIDSRLNQLRADAERADRNLQNYRIANGLMSSEGATLAEQETSTLNQQVQAARAQLAERQGRLAAARRQLRSGGGGSDVASTLNSGTIGSLREQEADSSRNLAQLRVRYGARHPSIAQEEQRLADAQRQIQAETDRILTSLEGEVRVAASGLASLERSQGRARGRLASNASAQVGFLELQRKAQAANNVYEAFLNRSRGTAARGGIEQPMASLSSAAIPATAPSSPNVRLVCTIGLLAGLLFSFLAVAVAEFLDNGTRTKADVEKRLGARYLGAVPNVASTLGGLRPMEAPEDYLVSHPLSSFAEAMRNLRASVTLRGPRKPRVIAVTSALPREGKTTTAICLARTLAISGASTVLLDCDVRRRSASDTLLDGRPGRLFEVLTGELSIDEAVLTDAATGLGILGTDRAPDDGRDLLAPDLVGGLLERLKDRYEYVVIDTAPVLGIADARSVASMAEAVIMLARWRGTSLRAVDAALDLLIGVRAKVVGVALTQVDLREFGSGGGDDVYGHHRKFTGYYVN